MCEKMREYSTFQVHVHFIWQHTCIIEIRMAEAAFFVHFDLTIIMSGIGRTMISLDDKHMGLMAFSAA